MTALRTWTLYQNGSVVKSGDGPSREPLCQVVEVGPIYEAIQNIQDMARAVLEDGFPPEMNCAGIRDEAQDLLAQLDPDSAIVKP